MNTYLTYQKASLIAITVVYGDPAAMENDTTKLTQLRGQSVIDATHQLIREPERHCELMALALQQEQEAKRRLAANQKRGNRTDPESRERVVAYMKLDGSSASRSAALFEVSKIAAMRLRQGLSHSAI